MERIVKLVAIVLVGIVGANLVVQLVADSDTVGRREMSREDVERDLLARPMAEVYALIETTFPEEYAEHIDAVQEIVNRRGLSVEEVGATVGEKSQAFLEELYRNNAFFIGQAPQGALVELQRASLALIESVRGDPELCADMVAEGATGFDRYEQAKLDPDLLQALTLESFRAMAAGRNSPEPHGAPSDDDWRSFLGELAELPEGTRADIRTFLDGEKDRAQGYCEGAIAFQRRLLESENPSAMRILADMISFSSIR